MSDEEQIRRLLAEFCVFLDDRRFREWSDLFTEDGTFSKLVGRETIFSWISGDELAREPDLVRKHTVHNLLIDADGDSARVRSDLVMHDKRPGQPWVIITGRYLDELVKQDGAWRFKNRQLIVTAKG
jgi:3-phenylpropionate/cinnamic acid dioxygenase small subunit